MIPAGTDATGIEFEAETVPPTIISIVPGLHETLAVGDLITHMTTTRTSSTQAAVGVRSSVDCTFQTGAGLSALLAKKGERENVVLAFRPAADVFGLRSPESELDFCPVCRGSATESPWLSSYQAPGGEEDFPCEICWGDSKWGVSTQCQHFYCAECILSSLKAILDTAQFPGAPLQCSLIA